MSFLPGLFPGAAGAARDLTEIVQQASATSTGTTITAPADIVAGDLLILLDRAADDGASIPSTVVPSGWTATDNQADDDSGEKAAGGFRQIVSYKLADGSEASSIITGMNGDNTEGHGERKIIVTFRGNIPAAALTLASVSGEETNSNPSAQNVAAGGGTPPLVVIGCYGGRGTVDPRTMSPAKDGEVLNQSGLNNTALAWKIQDSSPANVSVDMDDEGDLNCLQSFYIEMAA